MFNRLVGQIGFGWTMRTIAFIFLGLQAVGVLTVSSRLKHTAKRVSVRDFTAPFNDTTFLYNAFGCFFFFWGMIIPSNFMILNAESKGMGAQLAAYQLAIFNGVRYVQFTVRVLKTFGSSLLQRSSFSRSAGSVGERSRPEPFYTEWYANTQSIASSVGSFHRTSLINSVASMSLYSPVYSQ